MLPKDAEKYVCPFMTRPVQIRAGEHQNANDLFIVYCMGVDCMAWNPTGKNEGYCNLAFPSNEGT